MVQHDECDRLGDLCDHASTYFVPGRALRNEAPTSTFDFARFDSHDVMLGGKRFCSCISPLDRRNSRQL
jgi:hypothetical protein